MKTSKGLVLGLTTTLAVGVASSCLAKVTTISVWAWATADNALKQIIPDFEKKYPAIKVKLITMDYGAVHQKLLTTLAAGAGAPDVTLVEIAHIASFRAQKGLLVDLSKAPYFANKLKDDFVDYKWAHATDKGRVMALPWDIGPVGLYYRRDLLDKAGLPSDPAAVDAKVNTWEDFYLMVQKLTADTNGDGKPDQYGLNDAASVWNIDLKQNGCTLLDDSYNCLINGSKQEAFIRALRNAKRFRDAKLDQISYYSSATKSATCLEASWASGWLLKNMKKTAGQWGVSRLPGKVGVNNGGSFLAIPGGAKSKDAAWKFIQFSCATVEAQNKMLLSDGIFPAYTPAWKAPMYSEGVDFFAGQKANRLFAEIAVQTPFVKVYAEDEKLWPLVTAEYDKTMGKGKDPGQAIKDAGLSVQRYLATMPKRK